MTKPTRPPVVDSGESPTSGDSFPIAGRATDPQILLYVSPDGGMTWNAGPAKSLGAVGKYRQRVRWYRCGSGENLVLRFVVSDPTPLAALDLQISADGASA